jgi:hypothetical protein
MTKADRIKIESCIRLSYPDKSGSLYESDALIYKIREKEQIIMPGKWWINRRTPVGEDAELWKRISWNGRRLLDFDNIVAVYRKVVINQ